MGLTTQGGVRPRSRCPGALVLLTGALVLAGCGANMRAAVGTAAQALDGGAAVAEAPTGLDARFQYLRVQIGRQVGLMVQADASSATGDGITYWYSADGALIRLLQGRLVGIADGSRSWRATQEPRSVDWLEVARGQPLDFRRTVDQQPGYRIGLRQARRLQAVAKGPADHQLRHAGGHLQWFVEQDLHGSGDAAAWYAVDLAAVPPNVVYGQFCPVPDWCVSWQPWPPRAGAS